MPGQTVTESQFFMWRTLFAVAHADGVVADEEVRFMAEALEDVPFSEEQRAILNEDIRKAQNAEDMFLGITEAQDRAAFFKYARTLVHIDGEYGASEQAVMLRLKEIHLKQTDVDSLIGSVGLELEEESGRDERDQPAPKRSLKQAVFSFREQFMKDRFGL